MTDWQRDLLAREPQEPVGEMDAETEERPFAARNADWETACQHWIGIAQGEYRRANRWRTTAIMALVAGAIALAVTWEVVAK